MSEVMLHKMSKKKAAASLHVFLQPLASQSLDVDPLESSS